MRSITIVLSAVSLLALTGCATIMHGSKQDVGISSTPTSARVRVAVPPHARPSVGAAGAAGAGRDDVARWAVRDARAGPGGELGEGGGDGEGVRREGGWPSVGQPPYGLCQPVARDAIARQNIGQYYGV